MHLSKWVLIHAHDRGSSDHTGDNTFLHHSDTTNGRNIYLWGRDSDSESQWDSDKQAISPSESLGQTGVVRGEGIIHFDMCIRHIYSQPKPIYQIYVIDNITIAANRTQPYITPMMASMSCYVMSCYVILCFVLSCHVMLCYVTLCYVLLFYVVMLCCVIILKVCSRAIPPSSYPPSPTKDTLYCILVYE